MSWCKSIERFRDSHDWSKDPDWVKTRDLKRRIRKQLQNARAVGLSAEICKQLKAGYTLRLGFSTSSGMKYVDSVSLIGFTAAWKKLGMKIPD